MNRHTTVLLVGLALLAWFPREAAADITGLTVPPLAAVGTPVSITVTGTGTCLRLTLDFGEGAPTTQANRALPWTTQHTYTAAGPKALSAAGLGLAGDPRACPTRASANLMVVPSGSPGGPATGPLGARPIPPSTPATGSLGVRSTSALAVIRLCGITRNCPPPTITEPFMFNIYQPGGGVIVKGKNFGADPGRLLLKTEAGVYRLENLQWGDTFAAGKIPLNVDESLTSAPTAKLQVVTSDRTASNEWPITFWIPDLQVLPAGDLGVACSGGADENECSGSGGFHTTYSGYDGGIDRFSFNLKNGWTVLYWDYDPHEGGMVKQGAPYVSCGKISQHLDGLAIGATHADFGVWWNTNGRDVAACYVWYSIRITIYGPRGAPW